MCRLLLLVTALGACGARQAEPAVHDPVHVSGDATCSETLACYQECGGKNLGCDMMCDESATVQAQHDSRTLMQCLFDNRCYDEACAQSMCGFQVRMCQLTSSIVAQPITGSLVATPAER